MPRTDQADEEELAHDMHGRATVDAEVKQVDGDPVGEAHCDAVEEVHEHVVLELLPEPRAATSQ